MGDFITRVNDRYPLDIDNEELNSLLTTIKNQGEELEMKDKEISKLQNMLARYEKEEAPEAEIIPVEDKNTAPQKTIKRATARKTTTRAKKSSTK